MREWNTTKHELGFRLFGVAIDTPYTTVQGSVMDALCDNLLIIDDLAGVNAASDMFRLIQPTRPLLP